MDKQEIFNKVATHLANQGRSSTGYGALSDVVSSSFLPTSEQAKLTASDGAASEYFGYSVSISSDGTTALVGAYAADHSGKSDAGSAYIFV